MNKPLNPHYTFLEEGRGLNPKPRDKTADEMSEWNARGNLPQYTEAEILNAANKKQTNIL